MSAASFDAPGTDRDLGAASYRAEDFPGCESFHLPASEIDRYEGRLEFWDGITETAWKVCEPTSIYHEQPSRRLGRMAERVASLRGSAIECFGSADLVRLDAAGRKRWLMQADEVLYLHPDRARLPGPVIDVDEDPLAGGGAGGGPHDGRASQKAPRLQGERFFGNLGTGAVGGVGASAGDSRFMCRRVAGYLEEGESRAFPGWKAQEIHRALTETPLSKTTWRSTGTDGAGDGYAGGHGAGRRSAHPLDQPQGGGHGAEARCSRRTCSQC